MHLVVHVMNMVYTMEIRNLALLKITPWTWFYLLKHTFAFYPIYTTVIFLVILQFAHSLCHWNTLFHLVIHTVVDIYTTEIHFFHSAIHTIPTTVAIYPTKIFFLSSLLIPLLLLFTLLKNVLCHSSYSYYCCYLHSWITFFCHSSDSNYCCYLHYQKHFLSFFLFPILLFRLLQHSL